MSLLDRIGELPFSRLEEAVFRYQSQNNQLYQQFLKLSGTQERLSFHPGLPIQFFKTQEVQTGNWQATSVFSSSGTTGQQTSRHLVRDMEAYLTNAVKGFETFYGHPRNWVVLALLPSYLERQGSSLVAMAERFITLSEHQESGFFLHNFDQLKQTLQECRKKGRQTLLLGVSFALLDFAEYAPMDLSGVVIMETGGMKGRRKELTRTELHQQLKVAFGVEMIHSEYGMTELFSQAYSTGNAVFHLTPTMRVFTTEINDPFCLVPPGKTGVLNVVDLANLDTCSFIQTEDLGRVYADGSFDILGRLDAAELRGCNLMVE
ncbi:MAG TPA: hypothetical protein VK168_13165 [Saprospiraceae bacterium]|nr:hypothetical protein [Saprospiraceae bacterium]